MIVMRCAGSTFLSLCLDLWCPIYMDDLRNMPVARLSLEPDEAAWPPRLQDPVTRAALNA